MTGNKKGPSEDGPFCFVTATNSVRLQKRQRVVDDQTELFGIAFTFVGVSEVPGLANTEGQVFGRARLNYVFGFEVGFVVFAIFAIQTSVGAACWSVGTVDVPAFKETLKKTSRSGEIRTSHEQNG